MKLNNRTISDNYPLITTLLISVFLFAFYGFNLDKMGDIFHWELISTSITIATVNFGFLISILTMLVSIGNNELMVLLSKNGSTRILLLYNEKAVYGSAIWAVTAFLFQCLFPTKDDFENLSSTCRAICFLIWAGSGQYTLLSTYRYLRNFYQILKAEEAFKKKKK